MWVNFAHFEGWISRKKRGANFAQRTVREFRAKSGGRISRTVRWVFFAPHFARNSRKLRGKKHSSNNARKTPLQVREIHPRILREIRPSKCAKFTPQKPAKMRKTCNLREIHPPKACSVVQKKKRKKSLPRHAKKPRKNRLAHKWQP